MTGLRLEETPRHAGFPDSWTSATHQSTKAWQRINRRTVAREPRKPVNQVAAMAMSLLLVDPNRLVAEALANVLEGTGRGSMGPRRFWQSA
jgi:hypothetical protein